MNIGFDFKVNSCKAKGDGALYELVCPFLKCIKSYNKVTVLNFKTNSWRGRYGALSACFSILRCIITRLHTTLLHLTAASWLASLIGIMRVNKC